jgi:Protein of unknown function (DUF2752)
MTLLSSERRVSLTSEDAWPWLGPLALALLILASLLALLGLPPVDVHGPLHHLGVMDPFCGGTRAARFLMTGQWSRAWTYNPGIFALAALSAAALLRWMYGRAAGRWLHLQLNRRWAASAIVLSLLALDAHQQLHAVLLMQQ